MNDTDGERRRSIPLIILATTVGIAAVVGYLIVRPASGHQRLYLDSSGGAVVFAHAVHQDRLGSCLPCHHELVTGESVGCETCHDADVRSAEFDHDSLVAIGDHTCDGCHAVAAVAAARGCRECHAREVAEGETVHACETCHDDASYTPGLATHAELIAIEAHTCDGCHTPRSRSDADHAVCTGCHLRTASNRFADTDGRAACRQCHLK